MFRIATIGAVLLMGVPLVAVTSCIIKEDCVYTPKVGHPWRVTITATFKKNGLPGTVEAVSDECYSDEDSSILTANDPDDQQNAALRNQLLGNAQVDCVEKTSGPAYTEVKCNPFDEEFDGIVQFVELAGTCPQAIENGLEGTKLKKKAMCPDKPADDAGEEETTTTTTTGGETDGFSETGVPTTGDGLFALAESDLAAMLTCDGYTCHVSQAFIDLVLGDPAALLDDSTRLREATRQGQIIGMKFTGVTSGSLADRLGFQNGEVIVAVDGLPFRTLDEFVVAAAEIFDAETVTVTTERGSKRIEHVFIRN